MITPRFTLTQDDEFLHIVIYAPFTNLQNTEIFMEGTDFRFFSKPYYLRLHLPGEVEEAETAGGEYQADIASFVLRCPKKVPGEHFDGLEMITQLLTPSGDKQMKNQVEELDAADDDDVDVDSEDEIDWYYEQRPHQEDLDPLLVTESTADFGYGFNFAKTGVFKNLLDEFELLLDVKNPDSKSLEVRLRERREMETTSFDSDHYLCDLYETEEINTILSYQTSWNKLCATGEHIDERNPLVAFSSGEQEQLLALPRRTHKLTEKEKVPVFLTLVDLLYAHHYDLRLNLGETGPESGWCVAKLSATLSSCTKHASLLQAVCSALRRSLIYPLYRNWDLSIKVWSDVQDTLKVGKAAVIKSLLQILSSFGDTEGYYIFNQLYIQDYAVWIQSIPQSHLDSLSAALQKTLTGVRKADMDLELDELEYAAHLTLQEQSLEGQQELGTLTDALQKELVIDSDDSEDSETDDYSSDDDSDSSESDSDTTKTGI